WGNTSSSVSASATAEVFNPSDSANTGVSPNGLVTPVQPKCVKPWIVPNLDPGNAGFTLVNTTNGRIRNPGVSTTGDGLAGIVGERLYLVADCNPFNTTRCVLTSPADNPPKATPGVALGPTAPRKLEYLPGAVASPIAAIPSCASAGTIYETAVAG